MSKQFNSPTNVIFKVPTGSVPGTTFQSNLILQHAQVSVLASRTRTKFQTTVSSVPSGGATYILIQSMGSYPSYVGKCEITSQSILKNQERTSNLPLHVTVLIKNGKAFKIHRKVLSKASPFFENLLNSGMKEAIEGIIRLDMLTESVVKHILQFIYTGRVQISTLADAEDLMVATDYLLLTELKTVASSFLKQNLSLSNCISVYHFAESYQFNELGEATTKFIHSHLMAVAHTEDFLNLSAREVEKWISSDEIAISEEGDIFKIITMWVGQDRDERKRNFEELFLHVRLSFVSRDYLLSDIRPSDLIVDNEDCVNRVTSALRLIEQPSELTAWPQAPRKAQESQGILICGCKITLCYMPDSDEWYKLSDPGMTGKHLVSCRGRPVNFTTNLKSCEWYDAIFNRWILFNFSSIPENSLTANTFTTGLLTVIEKIFVFQGDVCVIMFIDNIRTRTIETTLYRYNIDSDIWQYFPLPQLGQIVDVCFVSSDKYVYALGGCVKYFMDRNRADASRYDMITGAWEGIAHMREARRLACGSAAHGNIFIVGGYSCIYELSEIYNVQCEMYNVKTNEWCLIANSTLPGWRGSIMCHGTDLYLLGASEVHPHILTVEFYDIENNTWSVKTKVPMQQCHERMQHSSITMCSARLFRGVLD